MKSNFKSHLKSPNPLNLLFIYLITCEFLSLFLLIANPSEKENQILLGFSRNRLILIGFVGLILGLTFLFSFTISRKKAPKAIYKLLETPSKTGGMVSYLIFIVLLVVFLFSFSNILLNRFVMARIRPIILMFLLIVCGYIFYIIYYLKVNPLTTFKENFKTTKALISNINQGLLKVVDKISSDYWFVALLLIISTPLLFYNALHYAYPTGFSGLYVLMSDLIAENGFRLPEWVPYYGPGGMPFTYPPFGFYITAFFTHILQVPLFIYLKFAPPFFMWLSLIPIALLTYEITKSRSAALIAAIVIAGSQRIFNLQATSGGIVRGLAFLLALLAIYFFILSLKPKSKKQFIVLSGLFVGLTFLTHFGYVPFILFFMVAYLLTHLFSKRVWINFFLIGIIGISFISPWVLIILKRYGLIVFLGAFQSHGNNNFLHLFQDLNRFLPWFEDSLRPIFSAKFIWGILILGLVQAFYGKKAYLSLWFVFLLVFTSENDRYLIASGAILIGLVISTLYCSFFQRENTKKVWLSRLFLLTIFIIFYQNGWQNITTLIKPVIGSTSYDLAEFVKENTSNQSSYLLIAQPEEAEWFPYLLERNPVAASWGGEWKGTYDQQLSWVLEIVHCKDIGSFSCIETLMNQFPVLPDLLITLYPDSEINQQIKRSNTWQERYQNERFILWENVRIEY